MEDYGNIPMFVGVENLNNSLPNQIYHGNIYLFFGDVL